MINNIFILVCNDGELELVYEVASSLSTPNLAVIGVSDLKNEIELLEAFRHYDLPLHFAHYEPNIELSDDCLSYEEIRNNRIVGIVGSQRLCPFKGIAASLPELVLYEMEKTKEHILTMRNLAINEFEYFFIDCKDDNRPWKNVRKNFFSKCKYSSRKSHRNAWGMKHHRKITSTGK